MSAVTSFKRKSSSKASHPNGTKPSLHNAQLLTSTGVPSLDPLLGGGICIGSVLLIEEDQYEHYSRILLKYFLAEGIVCGHSISIAAADETSAGLINDLPAAVLDGTESMPSLEEGIEEEDVNEESMANTEMKIAWRYKNKPLVKSSFSNRFGHNFDLTKRLDEDMVARVEKHIYFPRIDESIRPATSNSIYNDLTAFLRESLILSQTSKDSKPQTVRMNNKCRLLQELSSSCLPQSSNIVHRIALRSIGSPSWLQDTSASAVDLTSFIHTFRAIVKQSNAVGLVTIPTHLYQDTVVIKRLEMLFDCVIRLESFEGSEKGLNPLYKDYHGLFHLVKLPRINSLTAHYPDTLDLTFKLKRKKFVIEKLHLPPELSTTVSRTQEDPVQPIRKNAAEKINKSISKLSNLQIQNEF